MYCLPLQNFSYYIGRTCRILKFQPQIRKSLVFHGYNVGLKISKKIILKVQIHFNCVWFLLFLLLYSLIWISKQLFRKSFFIFILKISYSSQWVAIIPKQYLNVTIISIYLGLVSTLIWNAFNRHYWLWNVCPRFITHHEFPLVCFLWKCKYHLLWLSLSFPLYRFYSGERQR